MLGPLRSDLDKHQHDEKSQIRALERAAPVIPMGLGYVERVCHNYFRQGTTTLFAALDMQQGDVVTPCKLRTRFSTTATHKHAAVRAWLARYPRYEAR